MYYYLTRFTLLASAFFLASTRVQAQKVIVYDFSDSLTTSHDSIPALRVLGQPGKFVDDVLPELGNKKQKVYQFEANSGLQFDNKAADGLLSQSYTVELYFKLQDLESWKRVLDFKNQKSDNGCYIYKGRLNFFNFATGEKAPVRAGEYVHYVFSRDVETHMIKMYIDGESKVEFRDPGDEAVLDEDQVLNFFQDDLIAKNETSAGSVALIRLYDRVMTPVFVRQSFRNLATTITPTPPQKQETTPKATKPTVVTEGGNAPIIDVTGKIYSGKNLQFIENVNLSVENTESNRVVAETTTNDGTYHFQLPASTTYKITAKRKGFEDKSVFVRPEIHDSEVKTLINLEEKVYNKPIFVLPFFQSDDQLTPEAQAAADSLISFLEANPALSVELQGHTDNIGNFDKNLALSKRRASHLEEYLLAKGIAPSRIKVQPYGQTRPLFINSNEVNRTRNRRVEVWVMPIKR